MALGWTTDLYHGNRQCPLGRGGRLLLGGAPTIGGRLSFSLDLFWILILTRSTEGGLDFTSLHSPACNRNSISHFLPTTAVNPNPYQQSQGEHSRTIIVEGRRPLASVVR